MPLKIIEFDHDGQTLRAEMFYDSNNLSNAVLITPIDNYDDLTENIFLEEIQDRRIYNELIFIQFFFATFFLQSGEES